MKNHSKTEIDTGKSTRTETQLKLELHYENGNDD